jgi:Na+/H+ antiporter NhaD/arsenite permease-like protein
MEQTQLIALIIFVITYLGIIFTRLPGVNIDRPSAAYFGAIAMVLFGVVTPGQAISYIDVNTIFLLLGMMIIIATLQLDGFFSLIAKKTISWSKTKFRLLSIIVFVTGLASAFLVNDAVVLMFTPVIIQICRSSKLNPVPYLIAEILSSNAGSAMTITGNPQNMLIGISSGISYSEFLLRLLPVSIISMITIILIMRLVYRKAFSDNKVLSFSEIESNGNGNIIRSGSVFVLVIIGFFLVKYINLSIPMIAITGSALILLLGKAKPSDIIHKVDWVLLLFFASLFIVVGAVENSGLLDPVLKGNLIKSDLNGLAFVHGSSLIMSQIVSNVPFVVLMLPMLKTLDSNMLWLALASASTLAGNATIIGAMANLIVIESAEKSGIKIGFVEFLKSGIVVTILTMLVSFAVIYLQFTV